jgi:hypothetical protein
MRDPQYLSQLIRAAISTSGYASIPVNQQTVAWMMQAINALPDELNFVVQQMHVERQQYLANAIKAVLQGMGHTSLPVLQQNVGWMMQQVGAQPDEFNLVAQQMLQERQEYISQAIEAFWVSGNFALLPVNERVTQQTVEWMMHQIGALPDEYNFVLQRMQLPRLPVLPLPQEKKPKIMKAVISFGQIVEGPRATYNPNGKRIQFKANEFDPFTKVEVKLLNAAQHEVVSFPKRLVDTDGLGSIAHLGIEWIPTQNDLPGKYTFVATGSCNERRSSASAEFTLTA